MTTTSCPVRLAARAPAPAMTTDEHAQSPCQVARDEHSRFIPFVTPLKGEKPFPATKVILRPDGLGVGYEDENSDDRDPHDALWVRVSSPADGRPIPVFRGVSPRRARESMLGMRCQGCNGAPSRTAAGTLFFDQPDPRRDTRYWPETEYTVHPPVCLPCTQKALIRCPFVQTVPALRVKNPRPWGVFGVAYRLDENGTLRGDPNIDRCSYDDLKQLPWMLATQPIARLSRCTLVDVRKELQAAGLAVPPRPR